MMAFIFCSVLIGCSSFVDRKCRFDVDKSRPYRNSFTFAIRRRVKIQNVTGLSIHVGNEKNGYNLEGMFLCFV